MADKVNVGDIAPDFKLKDQNEQVIALSALKGKNVVLSWHPLAWTSICRTQMLDLEKHKGALDQLNAVALGLSVDSVPSKRAWADDMGVTQTSLLADFWPHGDVAQSYGVFRKMLGFSERAVFVVDETGIVRFKKVYPIKEVPDIDEIIAALQDIHSQEE